MKRLIAVALIRLGTYFATAQTSVKVDSTQSPSEQSIEQANEIIAVKPNDDELLQQRGRVS